MKPKDAQHKDKNYYYQLILYMYRNRFYNFLSKEFTWEIKYHVQNVP